ncbi:FGGY-family carbohydrate kinase [Lichenicola cladoniae]|uniref:FGGY-family carbohydrate kinase n=1 Tax=Lichenicola cladoniae TaxID=1484109 RepID=A0A6M8HT04_9PROT|nr:FGGY-family carbohydrate kinase [Lichenicola cladoniae]NPD65647.1 FGGY-family carbohydrate kinase [Acetobacteraceae bacterium]QKE91321.1 FGGY-family carbohydrate kinase [Lichenicola cladoniae]
MPVDAVIGIDVGTGSARAGLFSLDGTMLAQASRPIRAWRPRPDFVQQSSADIWASVCASVREACAAAGPVTVRGIGIDATCSLVVVDEAGGPVSISPDDAPEQDVIVWMDHRAGAEADAINAGEHDVLRYVGGRISLEMETPKLLWLREHRPDAWSRAAHFFDLPDWLTWRATGSDTRSLCSTVCKWTYLGHEARWDEAYFRSIGLGELVDEGFRRIGTDIRPMGEMIGILSAEAAAALGLSAGIPVGASAIDAHAGGIGTIGAALDGRPPGDDELLRRLALVGGTSSCHMTVSTSPRFVPGIWGPYFAAMVPGLWLNEGGQSATGSLIDHVITTHAAYPALAGEAATAGVSIYQTLNARLDHLAQAVAFPAMLTRDLHVMPDFHGNRSPRADSSLRGMISGLRLGADADDLALLYLATVQAIAYGTRHIIETLNGEGYAIDTILASGGGTKNPVFLREHADASGCTLVLPREPEAVLLGAAILGAVAGGAQASVRDAMAAMSRSGSVIEPGPDTVRRYHDAKYAVFQRMFEDQMAYRDLMTTQTA